VPWSKPKSSGGTSSFQDFQDSVRDAWDIEDDEFSVISATDVKISKKVAQSTALSVINSHRSGSISPPTKFPPTHAQPDVHLHNPGKSNPSAPTKPSGSNNLGPNPCVNANIGELNDDNEMTFI